LNLTDTGSYGDKKDKKETRPFFKAYAVLAIPNVVMSPALDEVQQAGFSSNVEFQRC
jgi:hypothetical protein